MVKEPLGFVKVLQWVSVVRIIGGGSTRGDGDGGVQKSRERGETGGVLLKWRGGMMGVEGDEGIGLQRKVPGI